MQAVSIYKDLFDYNDWANAKIDALCEGLAEDVLDAPRDMGFGSLRNTVFHIVEAEKIWLWTPAARPPARPLHLHAPWLLNATSISIQDVPASTYVVKTSLHDCMCDSCFYPAAVDSSLSCIVYTCIPLLRAPCVSSCCALIIYLLY